MELVQPEEGVGDEEVLDLGTPIVVNERAPVHVAAHAGIRMLVAVGAVEETQAMIVPGEVGRDPVQQHAQARLVAGVHEGPEIVRRAVPARGRKEAQGLVAPGWIEGMLAHGQQLHVGETCLGHVGNQLLRQFAVA